MAKNTTQQNEVIDYFDAALLYVYANSWQSRQNDDMSKLRHLAKRVTEAIEHWPINLSDELKSRSYYDVMDGLQARNRNKTTTPIYKDRIYWTATYPSDIKLSKLYAQRRDLLLDIFVKLNNLAYEIVEISEEKCEFWQIESSMRRYARFLAQKHDLPINYAMLANIVARHIYHVNHADTYGTLDDPSELLKKIDIYVKKSERDFEHFQRMLRCRRLIEELETDAKQLDIKIDKNYEWGLLANIEITCLKVLILYKEANLQKSLIDSKFNPEQLGSKEPKNINFDQLKTVQKFLKAKTSSLPDSRNYIFNTDHTDVRISGFRERASLALCIPFGTSPDKTIALVNQFKQKIRARILDKLDDIDDRSKSDEASNFFSAWDEPYKRIMIKNKGSILGLLAGLLCDHIFTFWKDEIPPGTKRKIDSVNDAVETTLDILKQHGFLYDAETVPKSRTAARRKIAAIPTILDI
ncbi:hypothetical protein [Pseudomonas sp. ICMP 561]|uniref:hypothetical protein n=1 Tax=Pseudomonas sp. ICMP 561 TaxID=1718918 RepID=UPI000C0AE1DA|nr:hypothetical protein [Pseudomonas sp. ICMP 561]PHN22804.1 hypothetical protein AO242_16125 [Pseudomonas sp. ICMP 561]